MRIELAGHGHSGDSNFRNPEFFTKNVTVEKEMQSA
jgi:hypothetical protein